MSFHVTYVKPDYYDKFHCISNKCHHNCCNYKWYISIDKQTYKKYRNFTASKQLSDKFRKYVTLNENPTALDYAHIVHLENPTRCTFEDENGLCMIHKELGYQYLSTTCKIYPRTTIQYKPLQTDIIYVEKSMSCGCEAVVELFLDSKEMMLLGIEQIDLTQNQYNKEITNTLDYLKEENRPILKDYYLIRSICIAILQNRELCFEDRLILLGLFSSKLNKLEQEKRECDVANEVNQFVNSLDEKSFAETFKDIKSDYHRQLLVSELMYKLFKSKKEEVFAYLEEKIIDNLQIKNETLTPEEKIPLLVEQYKQYLFHYNQYMSDKEHFIENLFTNELFRQAMPFRTKLGIYENFQYLTMMFVTYRYLVAFYIGDNKNITQEELIAITAYFGRTFLNDMRDPKKVIDFLGDDFSNLAEMALLIK